MTTGYDIVFMGTPDFAVPALKALAASGHRVVLVVTQPDRPRGRGRKILPPPVKMAAAALGCPTLQPPSLKDEATQAALAAAGADFFVVVAYGQILSKAVLAMPKNGCINVHASLLPRYRGPAPVHRAVIDGEKETGVCTMLMDPGLDTGDLLICSREEIRKTDTAGTLHDRLALRGAETLVRTLEAWASGSVQRRPQDHDRATYAPLLKKNDGRIDWGKPARAIEPFIRGMSPWPGAFTFFGSRRIKIFRAEAVAGEISAAPGTVIASAPGELVIAAGDGEALSVLEVQEASGNRLAVSEFLKGCRIGLGEAFG
jgi:methionyl-tRNA formyltransferase